MPTPQLRYPFYPGEPAYDPTDEERFNLLASCAQSEADLKEQEARDREAAENAETLASYEVKGIPATKKQLAIALLCAGKPIGQVAAECEISDRQLLRWRHDPQFKSELKRVAAAHQAKLQDELGIAVFGAIEAMREVLADSSVAPKDRVAAAALLLTANQALSMAENGRKRRK